MFGLLGLQAGAEALTQRRHRTQLDAWARLMTGLRTGLRTGALVCTLIGVLTAAPCAVAEPLALDATAMRQLAFTAVKAGYAEDGLRYTDALLQRDPKDGTALVIRSQALRALGRDAEAKGAAQAAWDLAETDPARFGAAMAMAQALSTGGRRTAAQWWLRRAAENAPDARAEAVARRDFRYVKSRNPWDVQINVTAAPSSNVNNGSQQDRLTLAGLPFQFVIPPGSQALSGLEAGLGVAGTYRFAPKGPLRQTRASFALLAQSVVLSSEAKDQAPDVSGADFSFAAIEAGLRHARALDAQGGLVLQLGAVGGHNWYGGAPLSDYLRLQAGLDRRLNPGEVLRFEMAADRVTRIDSPVQSSDRLELGLVYDRALTSGDTLSLGVAAARVVSDSDEVSNEGIGLVLGWTEGEPIKGVWLRAGFAVESKLFAASRYAEGGREDIRLTATVSMEFDKLDYMGFSPVLNLRAMRNRSNAALYDSKDIGITLGIRSSF